MKMMKYTFRTPLLGSIECSDVLPDMNPVELSSYQMCKLYCEDEELSNFLRKNQEDLTSCVDKALHDVVLRAEFGDFAMYSGKLYLLTHVWTKTELTTEMLALLMDWIAGQMSDGWGESLEQRSWKEERVGVPYVYFDEDSLTFEQDEDEWFVYYYVRAYQCGSDFVTLQEFEEVDLELPKMVASLYLPDYSRCVFMFTDKLSLIMFLKDNHREDLAEKMKSMNSEIKVYVTAEYQEDEEGHNSELITLADKYATQTFDEILVYDDHVPNNTSCIAEYSTANIRGAIARLLA